LGQASNAIPLYAQVLDNSFAVAAQALFITIDPIARGWAGRFVPVGIGWSGRTLLCRLRRYWRLNTISERSKEHLIAFAQIAFIFILSRCLKRLAVGEICA
jgi:hypothetical protein